MRKPEWNFQLGLLAKLVSCDRNFEPVAGSSYLERKRTVVAKTGKRTTWRGKGMMRRKEEEEGDGQKLGQRGWI